MLARERIFHPVYKELLGDLETPVSLYLKLNQKESFLLESVTGGESVARFSFIGFNPFCTFKSENNKTLITLDGVTHETTKEPFTELQKLTKLFKIQKNSNLPDFLGGAIGFFSWETIFYLEKIKKISKDTDPFPLAHFLFPRSAIIFDHVKRKVILMTLADKKNDPVASAYLDDLEQFLSEPLKKQSLSLTIQKHNFSFTDIKSNYQKEDFLLDVEKVKKYIHEGDIFQLVLSQRFSHESDQDPFDVYRKLRFINPSPYMFFFNAGDYQLIGTSPEILVRSSNRVAELRPIAGTRLRPSDPTYEQEVINDLLQDEKEKAEHIMLVDLARNDLGRVCQNVTTDTLMEVEKYSHVMHMVSNVTGILKKGMTSFDLFKASFPAGTVSGAPKIRAMEIIEELEPSERGPYAGALGYFDFEDNLNFCIIIRSVFAKNNKFFMQAGAGIVADSHPEKEYQETQNKALGILQSLF